MTNFEHVFTFWWSTASFFHIKDHQIQVESRSKTETMNKMEEIEKSSESMLHQFNELASRLEHLVNLGNPELVS